MKNSGKITGMLLMFFLAGNLSISAQRGMRGMRTDSVGMKRMRMEQRQMPLMMQNPDSLKMRGMHHGMAPGQLNNMDRFMCPMCVMGRQATGNWRQARGMNPAPGMGHPAMGMRQAAPGMRIMENIPNLTDKQKKDIAGLRQKQHDEMKKLQEEMTAKMQNMREIHRKNILNLLTDEQKKFLESKSVKTDSAPLKSN